VGQSQILFRFEEKALFATKQHDPCLFVSPTRYHLFKRFHHMKMIDYNVRSWQTLLNRRTKGSAHIHAYRLYGTGILEALEQRAHSFGGATFTHF
jgi:hypothetical protein